MRNHKYTTTTLQSFATETEGLNQEFSPMHREELTIPHCQFSALHHQGKKQFPDKVKLELLKGVSAEAIAVINCSVHFHYRKAATSLLEM